MSPDGHRGHQRCLGPSSPASEHLSPGGQGPSPERPGPPTRVPCPSGPLTISGPGAHPGVNGGVEAWVGQQVSRGFQGSVTGPSSLLLMEMTEGPCGGLGGACRSSLREPRCPGSGHCCPPALAQPAGPALTSQTRAQGPERGPRSQSRSRPALASAASSLPCGWETSNRSGFSANGGGGVPEESTGRA